MLFMMGIPGMRTLKLLRLVCIFRHDLYFLKRIFHLPTSTNVATGIVTLIRVHLGPTPEKNRDHKTHIEDALAAADHSMRSRSLILRQKLLEELNFGIELLPLEGGHHLGHPDSHLLSIEEVMKTFFCSCVLSFFVND